MIKKPFLIMLILVLLTAGFISCSSPSENNEQEELKEDLKEKLEKEPVIAISCNSDTVYTNDIFTLNITCENFSSIPDTVDVYTEDSSTVFASQRRIESGKVTIEFPSLFFGNSKKIFVKVGDAESNHVTVKFIYVVNSDNLEAFINSINTNETVKIKVLGNAKTIQIFQLFRNDNIRLNLDLSEVSNLYSLYNDKYFGVMSECNSIEYIIMPNEITVLQVKQFYNCKNLRGIIIPNSVTDLDWQPAGSQSGSTFEGCEKLEEIRLPDSLVGIATKSFYRCSSLKEIIIPASVTYIGRSAFNQSGVKRITFLNKTGWKVDGNDISEQVLADPENVATLLKNQSGYYNKNWTRAN